MKLLKSTLISITILLGSCSSDEPEATTVNKPKEEPTVDDRNAEYKKTAEAWKANKREVDRQMVRNSGMGLTRTRPVVSIDKNALKTIMKKSSEGDPEAQYQMGMCYKYGLGVKQDVNKCLLWMKKAADQGHIKAKQVYFYMLKRK